MVITLCGNLTTLYVQEDALDKFHYSVENTQLIGESLLKLESSMLMARRHEKDFLARNKEKYIEKHAKTIAKMNQLVDDAQNLDEHGAIASEDYDVFRNSVTKYAAGFKSAVASQKEEGNSKEGARGNLRSKAHEIEKHLKNHFLKFKGSYYLLMLRRHEKDYLLRRDVKYFNKAEKTINEFKSFIQNNWIGSERRALIGQVDQYLLHFADLVRVSDAKVNAIASFRSDIHAFEASLKKNIEILREESSKDIARVDSEFMMLGYLLAIITSIVLLIVVISGMVFRKITNNIVTETNKVASSSNETDAISGRLRNASNQVSAATTEQASAVQETVATLNEITAMVQQGVDNAAISNDKAKNCESLASEGSHAVSEVKSSMYGIADNIGEISGQVEDANQSMSNVMNIIDEIAQKTSVINDIVFQTKLLSFNASVEAARAGDQGKGFAVVAEEVGNLAKMSGESAKSIEDLLNSSRQQVSEIIANSQDKIEILVKNGREKVESGVKLAESCDEILSQVLDNITGVTEMMNSVSEASKESSTGINNITIAMQELDTAIAGNSDAAEDAAKQSQDLKGESSRLIEVTSTLYGLILGSDFEAKMRQRTDGENSKKVVRSNSGKRPLKTIDKHAAAVPHAEDDRFDDAA